MSGASTQRAALDGSLPALWLGGLARFLALGFYGLTGHIGLNLYDEGFLWCGVIHTAAGEMPLRDFQSYEPGRYWWGAAWSLLLGDGILAVRLSAALFQVLGLWCGLLVARRARIGGTLLGRTPLPGESCHNG